MATPAKCRSIAKCIPPWPTAPTRLGSIALESWFRKSSPTSFSSLTTFGWRSICSMASSLLRKALVSKPLCTPPLTPMVYLLSCASPSTIGTRSSPTQTLPRKSCAKWATTSPWKWWGMARTSPSSSLWTKSNAGRIWECRTMCLSSSMAIGINRASAST